MLWFCGCPKTEELPDAGPPPCGSHVAGPRTLIPGPGHDGYDAALAAQARKHDRQFHAINAVATGLAAEVRLADADAKAAVQQFIDDGDSWNFEGATPALGRWSKSAGLYGGVGIAADAYRYAVLRDTGADCAEVDTAREQLLRGLSALDVAARIPGVEGVLARSLLHRDFSDAPALTPLFDEGGAPLPAVKNNGTWRDDNAGAYPQLVWEDSLSRDMLVGWAMAFGAAFEALEGDDSFPAELRARLKEDALHVGQVLSAQGTEGFDLEIHDADGRLTFHAYLNENAIDRIYLAGAGNGIHALMALGIVGALAEASGDSALKSYVNDTLLGARRLDLVASTNAHLGDLGARSNYSGYNMAFTGAFLAQRYTASGELAGRLIRRATREELYARPDKPDRQPAETKQSFFDLIFIYAAQPEGDSLEAERATALTNALATLNGFPPAPFFNEPRVNCDETEVQAQLCVLDDGTTVELLGNVAHNDTLVAKQPIPITVRPRSNYYWRSNPYEVNDSSTEDGLTLNSGVDFRVAYWLGRWLR